MLLPMWAGEAEILQAVVLHVLTSLDVLDVERQKGSPD